MLQLRPNCELCDRDLLPSSDAARICSFECTFCAACAAGPLQGVCPNCGGNLVERPVRPQSKLAGAPASVQRVKRPLDAGRHAALLAKVAGVKPAER